MFIYRLPQRPEKLDLLPGLEGITAFVVVIGIVPDLLGPGIMIVCSIDG
jgi:hypothetical protein